MATDILVPKEEGRAVHEEGEEALPVEPMGLEDETFTWTKDMAVAFYQRTKAQHEDYINMTEKVIKENDQRIRGLEHAEAISQDKIKTTGEYADMRATRRDAQKQLEKEMKQKLEAANSDKEAAEADKEEAQTSYDDMAAVYNVAISEKKILESQLNIMTKDRDHHSKEAVQTKTKLEAEFQAYKKTRKEMLEHKEKYEHLVELTTKPPATPSQSPLTPTEVLEARGRVDFQKRVKESMKMTMAELEQANARLAKLYHRHNANLQEELNRAKAPEEIRISGSGACYHRAKLQSLP